MTDRERAGTRRIRGGDLETRAPNARANKSDGYRVSTLLTARSCASDRRVEATSTPRGDNISWSSRSRPPTGERSTPGPSHRNAAAAGGKPGEQQRVWRLWQNARTHMPLRRRQPSVAVGARAWWRLLDPGGSRVKLRRPSAFQSSTHAHMSQAMSTPGVERGLSRPRRDVLTTRQCGLTPGQPSRTQHPLPSASEGCLKIADALSVRQDIRPQRGSSLAAAATYTAATKQQC